MQTLYVELGERRYPIFIGSDLDPQALLAPYIHGKQVMIVSNTTVAPLYLQHYLTTQELGHSYWAFLNKFICLKRQRPYI